MKHFLLSFSFLFLSLSLLAQTALQGTVKDQKTQDPIFGATIQVKGTSQATSTNESGQYELRLDKGSYTLVFSAFGYNDLEQKVEITGAATQTFDLAWPEAGYTTDVIVFTEGKYAKKLEESTVSLDVVTPKMLENNVITSLDGAIQKVSGVQMMDGQVNIRGGAGYAYGAGSRVSFLVDGQLLLSAELSDVKWNFVPIENAEQIEVIKGSASVLYGSGALNGVINIRTAYPVKDKPYTAMTLYAGMYSQPGIDSMRWYSAQVEPTRQPGFFGGFFSTRQKLGENDQFDLVLGGNFHLENGYIKTIDERRFRLNFQTRYRPVKLNGKLSLGINGNMMYHEIGTFFIARDMRENAYVNIEENGRDRYVSINIDPYLTAFDKHNNKHDFRARIFNITKPRGDQPSIGTLLSGEYQFQRTFEQGWVLTAGTMAQHFRANSILFNDNSDPEVDRALFGGNSVAVYAQVDKKFFNRLSLTAGLRWEGFLIDTMFTPTPPIIRLGANYILNERNHLRASFGQGFRFPSLAERFINERLPVGGMEIGLFPNPNLKPEIGWSSELGYRYTYKNNNFRIYGDFALFWMEYRDMVEFVLDAHPEGLGFKTINVSQARIAGWEVSAQSEGKIGKFPLRLWGGYTYSYPGDMESDSTQRNVGTFVKNMFYTFANGVDMTNVDEIRRILRYRSMHNVRFDVETDVRKFTFGAVANYNSYVHRIDLLFALGVVPGLTEFRSQRTKGDWVFDLRMAYRFNDRQRLSFVVGNVANRVYENRPARLSAPRTFSIKYQQEF